MISLPDPDQLPFFVHFFFLDAISQFVTNNNNNNNNNPLNKHQSII